MFRRDRKNLAPSASLFPLSLSAFKLVLFSPFSLLVAAAKSINSISRSKAAESQEIFSFSHAPHTEVVVIYRRASTFYTKPDDTVYNFTLERSPLLFPEY